MKRKILSAAAVLLLLFILPYSAHGEATTPYVEIQAPNDGDTVGETTKLMVVAEGYNLRSPFVSIEGENGIAVGFPLEGCIYSQGIPETGTEDYDLVMKPEYVGPVKMYCNTEIKLNGFQGERIKLSVSVLEDNRILMDSVGLFVSGLCALR